MDNCASGGGHALGPSEQGSARIRDLSEWLVLTLCVGQREDAKTVMHISPRSPRSPQSKAAVIKAESRDAFPTSHVV